MDTIPFSVDLGVTTAQGVLRLEADGLAVEWRIYNLMDAPQGDLQSIHVPYADLEAVDYRGRLASASVTIVARRPSAFADFPLPAGSIATLKTRVKRRHRRAAEAWCAEAGLRIAEG